MKNRGFTPPHLMYYVSVLKNKLKEKGLPSTTFWRKSGAGFTLIELLVAFSLLVLILGGVLGLVQTAVRAQRDTLERQAAIRESSFIVEYISRAFRGIKKAEDASCIVSGNGWNFEIASSPTTLVFIDKDDRCRKFIWENEELKESIDGGPENLITSDDFAIPVFSLQDRGAYQGTIGSPDYVQPHLTISFQFESKTTGRTLTSIQTTITQRAIDVRQ